MAATLGTVEEEKVEEAPPMQEETPAEEAKGEAEAEAEIPVVSVDEIQAGGSSGEEEEGAEEGEVQAVKGDDADVPSETETEGEDEDALIPLTDFVIRCIQQQLDDPFLAAAIEAIQQLTSPPMPPSVQSCVASMNLAVLLDSGDGGQGCKGARVRGQGARSGLHNLTAPHQITTRPLTASPTPPPHPHPVSLYKDPKLQIPLFKLFVNILQNEDNLARFVDAQVESSSKGGLLRCMCSRSDAVRQELLHLVATCQAKQESIKGVSELQTLAVGGLTFELEEGDREATVLAKSANIQRHAVHEGQTNIPMKVSSSGEKTAMYWSFWMWPEENPATVGEQFSIFTDTSLGTVSQGERRHLTAAPARAPPTPAADPPRRPPFSPRSP